MSNPESKLKIELWPIAEVIPYELNAKKHPPEQIAALAKMIHEYGWDQPIVVDKHGMIIKGHGRRLAALELGLERVPVLKRADLTPAQVKAARLADNRVALTDIDPEKLRAELESADFDVEALRGIFDDKELDFMSADLGTVNTSAFISDMGATLEEQRKDLETRTDAAGSARVSLSKAFGFKDIAAADQQAITRLMSIAEKTTGKTGSEALVAYAGELEEV